MTDFFSIEEENTLKSALSGLTQFLTTENPLKIMKNAFYFTLRALFFPKIFKNKDNVNFLKI